MGWIGLDFQRIAVCLQTYLKHHMVLGEQPLLQTALQLPLQDTVR